MVGSFAFVLRAASGGPAHLAGPAALARPARGSFLPARPFGGLAALALPPLQLSWGVRSLYLVVGVVLLVVAVADLLWTTLWVDGGAGPLTGRLTSATWRGLRAVGGDRQRLLSLSGPVTVSLTLAVWVGLLWAGWTFVFAGSEHALIDTRNTGPISWTERTYFVAYTIFTMGNGDFTPNGSLWQLVTSLATASGMLFVTMSVTYVLSVLGAVAEKRSFAASVSGLGRRSEVFVRHGWDRGDFRGIDEPIHALASDLDRLAAKHKAYPVLHYYHSDLPETSSAVAVAVFDEATTVLREGVPADERPNQALLETARSSADRYLETLGEAFIEPADEPPPPPDLDDLREAGVPTVSDETFADALSDLRDRRRLLRGMVDSDAYDWPPVGDE